ncbi:MAG: OmpA family protein [Endozoicomonadaceae bacterium]|nr:OmpA family protein [Endozoicomonadaceae bacterium]
MRLTKLGKGFIVVLVAAYLAGCASTGGSSAEEKSENGSYSAKDDVTKSVTDQAVQAVVDSGKVRASTQKIAKLLSQKVYSFGFDSDQLDSGDYQALDVHAAYLNSEKGQNINLILRGHTDERGTRTYNLALGERRANTVKNYLKLKGVASDRMEVVSYGFEKPLDLAHTRAAWAKNRRVEIDSATY